MIGSTHNYFLVVRGQLIASIRTDLCVLGSLPPYDHKCVSIHFTADKHSPVCLEYRIDKSGHQYTRVAVSTEEWPLVLL